MERSPSVSASRLVVLLALLALILSSCGGTSSTAQPTAAPGGGTAPTAAPAGGEPATAAPAGGAAATTAAAGGAAATAAPAGQAAGNAGEIVFLSSQFAPVEEAENMRNKILANFPGKVEFVPEDPGPFNDRIRAEAQGGQKTISIIGGLHGDFAPFVKDGLLEDLTPLMDKLKDRGFPEAFVNLSKYGGDKVYYIPWMQATYVMAANKKALQYLPQGADQNALTYDQLKQWGENIQKATGDRKLGFPGGPKGLIHRLFQGYLYPSYTGSAGVVGFKAPEATQMWTMFKDLWGLANPQSANYEFMQEPLLSEEVWVAMDHTARLINAAKEKPDDFVLLPAPAGPKGRGFMPVIAGFAIPKGAPNRAGAEQLIEYLTMADRHPRREYRGVRPTRAGYAFGPHGGRRAGWVASTGHRARGRPAAQAAHADGLSRAVGRAAVDQAGAGQAALVRREDRAGAREFDGIIRSAPARMGAVSARVVPKADAAALGVTPGAVSLWVALH